MNVKVVLVKENKASAELTFPKIEVSRNKDVAQKINNQILSETKEWRCAPAGKSSDAQSFTVSSTVERADDKVLSYKLAFDLDCGGAYPDAHEEARTFDMSKGKKLSLSDILNTGVLPKALVKGLLKGTNLDQECKTAYDDLSDDDFQFFFGADKLVLFPEMAHALQGCVRDFEIKGEALKRAVKKNYLGLSTAAKSQ